MKISIKKIDIKLFLSFIPIYLLNCCTSGFFKIEGVTTVFIIGSFLLWLLYVISDNREFIHCLIRLIWPLIICLFFLLFCYILPNKAIHHSSNVNNVVFLIIITATFYYYICFDKSDYKQYFLIFWVLDTVISSMYSLIMLTQHPQLARYLATSNATKYTSVNIDGIISYAVIYGFVLIVPVILYKISVCVYKNKIIWILLFGLYIIAICSAQFTLALLLCVGAVILFMLNKAGISKFKIFWRIFFIILFIIVGFLGETILVYLIGSNILPYEVHLRVIEIYNFIYLNSQETSMDLITRLSLYSMSFESIWSNMGMGLVVLGNGNVGGHSEILDTLANYGIVYFSILTTFFVNYFRFITRKLNKEKANVYMITIIIFVIQSFVNTSMWSATIISLLGITPILLIADDSQNVISLERR